MELQISPVDGEAYIVVESHWTEILPFRQAPSKFAIATPRLSGGDKPHTGSEGIIMKT